MKAKDGGLRAMFRTHLPHFHWVTVETGLVERGVPDSNYCHLGYEGWIEYKTTDGWALGSLKQEQVAWILRRSRVGGRVFIAVRRAGDDLYIFDGKDAQWLKTGGLKGPALPVYKGTGGPRGWAWDDIEKTLKNVAF